MNMRRHQQSSSVVVIAWLLLVGVSACASLAVRERVVVTSQALQIVLGQAQDAEMRAYTGGALTGVLTPERHKAFHAALIQAFDAQSRLATVLKAWQAGDPVPPDLATLMGHVKNALAVLGDAAAGTPLAGVIATVHLVLARAAELAVILGGAV